MPRSHFFGLNPNHSPLLLTICQYWVQSTTYKNYLYFFFCIQQCTLSIKLASIKISKAISLCLESISVALLSQDLQARFLTTPAWTVQHLKLKYEKCCWIFLFIYFFNSVAPLAGFDDACCCIISRNCWLLLICSVRYAVHALTALYVSNVLRLCDRVFLTVGLPAASKVLQMDRTLHGWFYPLFLQHSLYSAVQKEM